jgi:hypothetical protein
MVPGTTSSYCWEMATWTCPDCNRSFGAVGRNHLCSPGVTVKEFLSGAPGFVEPVFRAVNDHLQSVDAEVDGDLIVDPLESKVLFKNGPTFCIVDVKTKWVAVGFSLRRSLETARLSRKTSESGGRHYHVINVDDPQLIDDEFRAWLTEAYHHGAGESTVTTEPSHFDPMVPDDIDFEIAPPR